MSLIMLLFNLI